MGLKVHSCNHVHQRTPDDERMFVGFHDNYRLVLHIMCKETDTIEVPDSLILDVHNHSEKEHDVYHIRHAPLEKIEFPEQCDVCGFKKEALFNVWTYHITATYTPTQLDDL